MSAGTTGGIRGEERLRIDENRSCQGTFLVKGVSRDSCIADGQLDCSRVAGVSNGLSSDNGSVILGLDVGWQRRCERSSIQGGTCQGDWLDLEKSIVNFCCIELKE